MAGIEAEVFLIGRWDNFEEMEEKLTMQELGTIANAIAEKSNEDRRFLAAIQGIDLDKGKETTFEEIERKARGDDPTANDLVNLTGAQAQKDGFGINMGVGLEDYE